MSQVTTRLIAYVIDCALLLLALFGLQLLLYPVNPIVATMSRGEYFAGWQLHLWVSATTTVPFVLYFASMFASKRQATLGMHFLGLRVTDLDGRRISFGRALLRAAILLVPFELNHTVMFELSSGPGKDASPLVLVGIAVVWLLLALYLVTAAAPPRGQSIHDRIAGTVVVSVR